MNDNGEQTAVADARPAGSARVDAVGGGKAAVTVEVRRDVRQVLARDGERLAVYDLDAAFAGDASPRTVIPFPWPGWRFGEHSADPAGRFVALSGQRSVRVVDGDGATRWEFRHPCWDAQVGHDCDPGGVCGGHESGSCRVSDDGRFVWAHVPAPAGLHEGGAFEEWVVLDAADGTLLARTPVQSAAQGSSHLSHPDGLRMGLSIGEGQDGSLLYWARWDGEQLTVRDLNDGDLILLDTHPAHDGFLTLTHDQDEIALHDALGERLATGPAESLPADGCDIEPFWDYYAGFVDAETVIASTVEYDENHDEYEEEHEEHEEHEDHGEHGRPRHWLLDARTLRLRARVRYPRRISDSATALGDGTWLTYQDGVFERWRIAAGG
ncbi:hypothetical protein AB0M28_09425 [Streptomyces sp. NPDC051940]|uniref:hypothetical protein n=1 Tax=Streptomyces sp. NPDC051940 TaxID=3155675 RepID=UPI00341901ED